MIPVILGLAILIFTIMYFTPGNPVTAILGNDATAEQILAKEAELGLNQPYIVQLLRFLKETFLEFNLGNSYISGKPVLNEIMIRLPQTMLLSYVGALISLVIGIPLGVLSSINRNNWKDGLISFAAMFGASLPSFWFALVMVLYLAVKWQLLPVIADGSFSGYIMAWISISIGGIATTTRQMRSSMLEVIRQDYISTARAKGENELRVVGYHALKNALIPVITATGSMLGAMFGVALVAETIFSVPGMGVYLMNAITQRDYPIIRGGVLALGIIFSLTMLLVDLMYAVVDPRLRDEFKK